MQRNSPDGLNINFKTKILLIILGFSLFLMLLEIGLRLGGFMLLSIQEHRNRQAIKQKSDYRIMCLGESTTAEQYPVFLEEILNQRNKGVRFSVIDKGLAGINTSTILWQLESNLNKYRPDMVVVMMGINDRGAHIPYEPVNSSKIMLSLRSFRTYKLVRILWLHILNKAKEMGLYNSKKNKQHSGKATIDLSGVGLKENYVGSYPTENSLKRIIELNSKNEGAYVELGLLYFAQGKFPEAEYSLKKVIELNPKNEGAYVELGLLYFAESKFSKAEYSLKKAIELNPVDYKAYIHLGNVYIDQGKFSEAEVSLKKAIELNPANDGAFFHLGRTYLFQGKFSEAEGYLKKALELNPINERVYGAISLLNNETGNLEFAKEYEKKINRATLEYYCPVTVNNYHRLKEIVDKKKLRLVCMQYPVRSIKPLKKIFEGQEGIIFVDNEKIFKDAVKIRGYRFYFTDMFGGDFGHCTYEGNRLLAENTANVILKKVFVDR